jgi:anthranilate synthase component II
MTVTDTSAIIFNDVSEKFMAARYHSWAASDEDFPTDITITARDEDGGIQALEHKLYNISAVQFHPESILTDIGEQLVRNFINSCKVSKNL